ncbi:MAG: helix-turn-helix domain-containing protein [Bifidobacteriaceae bacterium]|jgi:transcriptional regulator with XRE-family HTH domain|nr:helix-turn-helix domain-containing protein [Bifidobacteriaceae bacterium]
MLNNFSNQNNQIQNKTNNSQNQANPAKTTEVGANLGQTIKKRRNELNMTQKDLADKLHISFQAVSKWENNESIPDSLTLKHIAEVLQTSSDNLLNGNKINLQENINLEKELSKISWGNLYGIVTKDIRGDVGSIYGDIRADIYGNVKGKIVGSVNNIYGNVEGNILGVVNGNISGYVGGKLLGLVKGRVEKGVRGKVLGTIIGNGIGIKKDKKTNHKTALN